MKKSTTKIAATPQTPVFKIVIHKPGVNLQAATPSSKSQKRDNDLSQSRATREDRSARQMKTPLNSEMLFRFCGHLSP